VELISWLIIGLIVGGLARLFLPGGPEPVGCLGTIFIGIAGAVLGGRLWEEIFGPQPGIAWIGSILMAMFLLAIFRWFSYRT
jgi:uncharacterized membrane protein YeaQ/YmgE (transglycosylase-associated protein family)